MMNCNKCGGLLIPGASKDFYIAYTFSKCMICGKEQEVKTEEYEFRPEMIVAK